MHRSSLGSLAVAILAASATSSASAQSVLERVLGQIENSTNIAPVNGVYANIAESVGDPGQILTETLPVGLSDAPNNTILWELDRETITVADIGTTFSAGDGTAIGTVLARFSIASVTVNGDGSLTIDGPGYTGGMTFFDPSRAFFTTVASAPDLQALNLSLADNVIVYDVGGTYFMMNDASAAFYNVLDNFLTQEKVTVVGEINTTINGSINNTVTGITETTAVATASIAMATEFTIPTFDFGDMATTALGAVNTGDITLGVNAAVDEAKTTYTNAISAALTQLGGSVDTGAIIINVASNMSAVDGAITNVLNQVNGSIGNLSTTALGAVNTGTIVSGVDAAVQGIVGMSGQTSF